MGPINKQGGTSMTPEELMKPRYKVVADYPGNVFEIGSVITFLKQIKEGQILIWAYKDRTVTFSSFDKYPHLFKPLQWWEHREDIEMPEYVIVNSKSILSDAKIGAVYKVVKHFSTSTGKYNETGCQLLGNDYISYNRLAPADLSDYNEYLKQKEANNG